MQAGWLKVNDDYKQIVFAVAKLTKLDDFLNIIISRRLSHIVVKKFNVVGGFDRKNSDMANVLWIGTDMHSVKLISKIKSLHWKCEITMNELCMMSSFIIAKAHNCHVIE